MQGLPKTRACFSNAAAGIFAGSEPTSPMQSPEQCEELRAAPEGWRSQKPAYHLATKVKLCHSRPVRSFHEKADPCQEFFCSFHEFFSFFTVQPSRLCRHPSIRTLLRAISKTQFDEPRIAKSANRKCYSQDPGKPVPEKWKVPAIAVAFHAEPNQSALLYFD